MIQKNMYVIAVPDLAGAAAYYRDVLGFSVRDMGDEGWRMFVRDGCQIMAGHCPDAISPKDLGDHSYFAYIVVDDADKYHAEISGNGAQIIKALKSEPWGMREFGVRTNDGHRMMFGQDLDP
ncbi:MAG: VOC family protein [Pseudomonadota bacterium]